MTAVTSVNPATGERRGTDLVESDAEGVRRVCATAASLSDPTLSESALTSRPVRAAALRAAADAFEYNRNAVVTIADSETALGQARLNSELTRVCFQLRLFADVLDEGSYLELTIDHAGPTDMGPRPDLRRMLVPTGPVAIFGSSNFPLAFSVPGGDTVAAIAAGCPVVVKGHPAHPLTSHLCAEIMRGAFASVGLPADALQLVFGFEAGRRLVLDPDVTAVSFTGSLSGGRALLDLIATRDDPIPFYGELSGINPAVITPGGASQLADQIAHGLATAVTASAGQLCTKPGVVLVPMGESGDDVVNALATRISDVGPAPLLTSGIAKAYHRRLAELAGPTATIAQGAPGGDGFEVRASVSQVSAADAPDTVWKETFGPTTTVVRYADEAQMFDALRRVPGTLAISVQHGDGEDDLVKRIADALTPRAGRLVFNAQTTGVAVSWAQHHGGPWPSTNSSHTSVGPTAIRRFLRPVVYQDAPVAVLPAELRDEASSLPRRIDGRLT